MPCSDCKFYVINPGDVKMGWCHLNPPSSLPSQDSKGKIKVSAIRPPVLEKDVVCGHFKMIDATN